MCTSIFLLHFQIIAFFSQAEAGIGPLAISCYLLCFCTALLLCTGNPTFAIGTSAQANIAGRYHDCNIIGGPNAAQQYTVCLTNGAQHMVPASSLRSAQPSAAPVPVATSVPVVTPVATATYPTTSVPAKETPHSKAPLDDVPVASYPTPAAGIYPPVPAAVPVANQAPAAVTGVAVNTAVPAPKTVPAAAAVSGATITVKATKKTGSSSMSATIDSTATDLNRQMKNLNTGVNKYLGKGVGNFLFGSKKKKTKKTTQPKPKFTVTTTTSVRTVNGKKVITKTTTVRTI